MKAALITFFVGGFAGLCAVFVPRMGGLLAARDIENISIFPVPFVVLGVVYAAAIGIVVLILYYDDKQKVRLRQKFVTALGVPALVAGTLTTGAQTNEMNDLQGKVEALSAQVSTAEGIHVDNEAMTIQPLDAPGPSGSIRPHELLGIGTAYAAPKVLVAESGSWGNYGAIQAREPNYAIVVYRTNDANKAREQASQLKRQFPDARAIRMSGGFAVITGVLPQSSATLEAAKIKRDTPLVPMLVRVK